MTTSNLILIIVAVLGSSVLTAALNRYFLRKNDSANAHKTEAEATDILTQAADRTLQMMHSSMVSAQAKILMLEDRVTHLERQVREYELRHGPLDDPWDTGVPGV